MTKFVEAKANAFSFHPLPVSEGELEFSSHHAQLQKDLLMSFGLQKGFVLGDEQLVDDNGFWTPKGVSVITAYANAWLAGSRDLEAERAYPDLTGSFYDVRSDPDYARRWADDVVAKSTDDVEQALVKAGLAPVYLLKVGSGG